MADEPGKVANWVWERRDEILSFLGRLRAWFRGERKDTAEPISWENNPRSGQTTVLARWAIASERWIAEPHVPVP